MKIAFVRGKLWFFGFLVVVFVCLSLGAIEVHGGIGGLLMWAVVFGGLGFCITLYDNMKEEQKLQLEARRRDMIPTTGGSGIE